LKFGAAIIVPNFINPKKPTNKRILLELKDYISPKILSLKISNKETNEIDLNKWSAINLTE
jgi:hypothetical protein